MRVAVAILCASCAPGPIVEPGRWDQCPPAGVDLSDCQLEFNGETGIGLSLTEAIPQLDAMCASPCTSAEHVVIVLKEGEELSALKPLTKMRRITTLSFGSSPGLTSLEGLPGTLSIQQLVIERQPNFESLRGLPSPNSLVVVELTSNPKLVDISALNGAASIGDLRITSCDALTEIDGLDAITLSRGGWPNGRLTIVRNKSLRSIRGLAGIVDGTMVGVAGNPELLELTILPNVRSLYTFEATDNPKLPKCQVDAIVARLDEKTRVATSGNQGTGNCE